jgi:putative PIN family toxin of toxin-antitoxin system
MRVVLDTNILVRAHANARGPARELLLLVAGSLEHTLLLSPFLLRELERVFGYQRVRKAIRLTEDEIVEYLIYLRSKDVSELIFPGPAPRVVPSDEEDDPVVHTAVIGRADALCTLNRHFYAAPVLAYCKDRGVFLASDVDLLRTLRAGKELRIEG